MRVTVMAMFVAMAFVGCTAEKTAYLVRSEIRDNVSAGLELIGDSVDIVSLHDAEHHFLVNGERNVNSGAFNHSGPVLVAECVTEFNGYADYFFRLSVNEPGQVDDKHIAEIKPYNGSVAVYGVVSHNVAVGDT